MERQGGLIAFAPSNAKHACIATTDALQMSQSPTGAITGMANGHDNLLDLPPRAPEVSEAVAPRGFAILLQQHSKGLVQFLRQRTVPNQDAADAAREILARLLRSREAAPTRPGK